MKTSLSGLRHEPFGSELAAVLGGSPLPQLTGGVVVAHACCGWVVAVLGCGSITTRTLQGMARVWSGQASAWPADSGRSARRSLQDQA
jgi:hypothetical protein